MKKQIGIPAFLLMNLAVGSGVAHAQVIVSPNGLETTEGDGRVITAPFNNVSRYQQIYDSTQFATLSGPQLITQIAFRPDRIQTTAFSQTLSSIRFDLSTTSTTVSGLSSNFGSNVGANDAVVYNGALTFTTANTLGTGTAKQFDLVVNLTTPFLYDPGAGNLLLDIRNSSSGFSALVDANSAGGASPAVRLNFLDNSISGTNGTVQLGGIVTKFTFQSAAVPEPGSIALLASCSLFGTVFLIRRRKKRINPMAVGLTDLSK